MTRPGRRVARLPSTLLPALWPAVLSGALSVALAGTLLPAAPAAAGEAQATRRLGLPPLPPPPVAGLDSPARVALGRKLFFDRRLSFNGSQSCAMCHVPQQGFTTTTSRTSVGIEGRSLRRNAPTLLNVAWQRLLFHDGRETSLVTQAWMPLLHADEMGNPSIGHVLDRISALADYAQPLRAASGQARPTMATVGEALAAYQRTLVSAGSRFDRWRYGAEAGALSAQEQLGHALFTGAAGCSQCHTVGPRWALFTDHGFHVTGAGQALSSDALTVQLAPGFSTQLTASERAAFRQHEAPDLGRYEISLQPADRQAFKTPSLRNVASTPPYMHDGSLPTLAAVVEFYDGGGGARDGRSPRLRPLGLSAAQKQALVAFLQTLTGQPVSE